PLRPSRPERTLPPRLDPARPSPRSQRDAAGTVVQNRLGHRPPSHPLSLEGPRTSIAPSPSIVSVAHAWFMRCAPDAGSRAPILCESEATLRIFSFDPALHRRAYRSQGWAHIRDGVTSEFLDHIRGIVAARNVENLEKAGHRGAKDQFLYDPPDEVDLTGELFELVGSVCALNSGALTLSESHLNFYESDAPKDPPAHKDRVASQVTVGISVDIPADSCLVLYPFDHREVNRFFMSADLRDSLDPNELPEVVLRDARSVELRDRPGDVVIFPGSSMWHLRRNSANAVNLYLKCNDFDCDPLAEDPTTRRRRQMTEAILSMADANFDQAIPALSRQLEWSGSLAGRDWDERLFAKLWDQRPFPLNDVDLAILKGL